MPSFLVDSEDKLIHCLQVIITDLHCVQPTLSSKEPLFCDFECIKLGKYGELCLGQFATRKHTFLIDFMQLRQNVTAIEYENISIKTLLEAPDIIKVIFDPRRDSMALFFQYNIAMQGVICLQLLDVACRRKRGHEVPYVRGLAKMLPPSDQSIKQAGKNMFLNNPYVWKERPLPDLLIKYSTLDVEELIPLYDKFKNQLNLYWINLVINASKERVEVYTNPDIDFSNAKASRRAPKF